MKLTDFYDKVIAHPELSGYLKEGKDAFVIYTKGHAHAMEVPVDTVIDNTWVMIEKVLTRQEAPTKLIPMTRVVGYLSRTDNWNKSKTGELKDRQKGKYAL